MLKLDRPAIKAAALALAVMLAPAAQAAGGHEAPSRDTGVGKEIAAQGNRALQTIRAELKAAVKAMQPTLPKAAPRVVKMSLPAGSTLASGSAVACDQ